MKNAFLLFTVLSFSLMVIARPSAPAPGVDEGGLPDLVHTFDSTAFRSLVPSNGFTRLYRVFDPDVSYISTITKVRIDMPGNALVCIEGTMVNGKRQGLFTTYVIDNTSHSKRYKIHEQSFKNDLLDGHWKAYDIGGTLKFDMEFRKGLQSGLSAYYGDNGKSVIQTTRFLNDTVAILTKFAANGQKQQVQTMLKGVPNGPGTVYYPDGSVMTTANFLNGQFNDTLKYYYPNGVLWTEEIFKKGLDWTVLGNYDNTGKPRNAGTLKNGNGTRVLYTEEGQVRQVINYVDGLTKYK